MLLIVFLHSHLGERVVRAGARCGGLPWGWWHRLVVRLRPKRGVIRQSCQLPQAVMERDMPCRAMHKVQYLDVLSFDETRCPATP